MRVPDDRELLSLWERGSRRHPIDRALLLGVWARPELAPQLVAELPLGALNAALLRLREACFGSRVEAFVDCRLCGTRTELVFEVGELLADSVDGDVRDELRVAGFRFRVPDSRDLASVATGVEPGTAALHLLERCCTERPEGSSDAELSGLLAEVEAGLEMLDPTADLELSLDCQACGGEWTAGLHIAELLWDELDARARMLLREVHSLARSYGWTESEILSLSSQRRATYMELVGG